MSETLAHEPATLPHPHTKVTKPSVPEAQWLVLEYLAADNNLEGELLSDLAEMERVGHGIPPHRETLLAERRGDRRPSGPPVRRPAARSTRVAISSW